MSQLKVTQIRSTIGNKRPARESVRSLGLKRVHHSVVVDDNAVNRGYIRSATHLLTVSDATDTGSDATDIGAAGSDTGAADGDTGGTAGKDAADTQNGTQS